MNNQIDNIEELEILFNNSNFSKRKKEKIRNKIAENPEKALEYYQDAISYLDKAKIIGKILQFFVIAIFLIAYVLVRKGVDIYILDIHQLNDIIMAVLFYEFIPNKWKINNLIMFCSVILSIVFLVIFDEKVFILIATLSLISVNYKELFRTVFVKK